MSNKLKNDFLAKSISKLYLDADSSDVKFVFYENGETQFVPAHKAILGSESAVFYAMFFGPLKGGEIIEVIDSYAEAFKEFVQLFYLPEVTITMENIAEVIRLADYYDMLDHLNTGISHLETKLSDDNMFSVYQLAIELGNAQLKQFCEEKMAFSVTNIFESNEFLHCDQKILKNFLQINQMFIDEIDVFNGCLAWAKISCQENGLDESNPSNLKKQLADCFYLIRFGSIDKTDFDVMMSNERYTGLFEPDELIDIARLTTVENYGCTIFKQISRISQFLWEVNAENIGNMSLQFDNLKINTEEDVANVISLVTTILEKAIDKPNFSWACAKLCQKMKEFGNQNWCFGENPAYTKFKIELLNKCQNEFEKLIADENSIHEKLKPIQLELDKTTDDDHKSELTVQLEEEKRKLRRRSVGTVRFIGELYCLDMLHTNTMELCAKTLLEIGTDEKLECLCELLTIVGEKMERKTNHEDYNRIYYRDLTSYFQFMQQITSGKNQSNKISSRVRSMLEDVTELRKNKWIPRRIYLSPKKMFEIELTTKSSTICEDGYPLKKRPSNYYQ